MLWPHIVINDMKGQEKMDMQGLARENNDNTDLF